MIPKAIFMGHSFGSAHVSWMIKARSARVEQAVFLDPIVFLFNSGDLTYNFLYKKTNDSHSNLVDYFIRRDLFVMHTLCRHFWWYAAFFLAY